MFALSRKSIIVAVVVSVVLSLLMYRYLSRVEKRHYCDFRVYHHTAGEMMAGGNIYDRESEAITPFKYSPFFAFMMAPIGLLPIKWAAAVFFLINCALTVLFFYLAARIFVDEDAPARHLYWIYGLTALFTLRFVFQILDSGQVNTLMCALVALGLYFHERKKDIFCGAFLAAAIMVKYTPAIFLPYFLLRGRFKAVGWTLVWVIVWLVVPAMGIGWAKNWQYLGLWIPSITENSLDRLSWIVFKNQSLYSMVIRYTSDIAFHVQVLHLQFKEALKWGYVAAVVVYVMPLLPGRTKTYDRRIDYALLFTLLPLLNPNGWMINFVALVVPFVYLLGYLMRVKGRDIFVWICIALAVVGTSLFSEEIVGNEIENVAAIYSCVTLGALALFFALLKLKFIGPARLKT